MILNFNNLWCSIQDASDDEIEIVKKHLTYTDPKARHTTAYKKKKWKGKKSLYHKRFNNFPTGLLPHVIKKLDKEKISYTFLDSRPNYTKPDFANVDCKYELWYSQKEAIEEFLNKPTGRRGIFQLPTRSGKSVIAGWLMMHLNIPSLMIVPDKRLLHQTGELFQDVFNMDVGILGDSMMEPKLHNIAIINTVARYLKNPTKRENPDKFIFKKSMVYGLLQRIEFLIIDECHNSSKDCQLVSRMAPMARWRLGLSATPLMGHKGQKLHTQAITGPVIYEQSISQLANKDLVIKPTVIFLQCKQDNLNELTEWNEIYEKGVVLSEKRNNILAIAAIKTLKQNKRTMILVESTAQGNKFLDIFNSKNLKSQFVYGKHNADQRSEAIKKIEQRQLDILIASRIFNQGIDIPLLDCVIIAGGYRSSILTYQRYGRPITKKDGKNEATVIDIFDRGNPTLEKHSQERISLVNKEKAFEIQFKTIGEL